ncbi:MAG TPA: hypothetical protein VHN14_36690 [Kofleriaceae bacterium]|nr:hypothetical protein [Kofleriaceae bacterium]
MRRSTVVIELVEDAQFARDLAAGGVFVPGCTLQLTEECDLVVRGSHDQISLAARVVYVEEDRGAGLELVGFSSEMMARLAELGPVVQPELEFIDEPPLDGTADDEPEAALEDSFALAGVPELIQLIDLEALADPGDDDLAITGGDPDSIGGGGAPDAASDPGLGNADTLPPEATTERKDGEDMHDPGEPDPATSRMAHGMHERLRGLSVAAQLKAAASGDLHERVVLERLYGKNVWETLLRNPRLTAHEVSRMARYGSLPRVLLDIIVANQAWLHSPEVRRSLLSNPRLAADQIMKILHLMPRPELKLITIQTAYPPPVRSAARLILRSE